MLPTNKMLLQLLVCFLQKEKPHTEDHPVYVVRSAQAPDLHFFHFYIILKRLDSQLKTCIKIVMSYIVKSSFCKSFLIRMFSFNNIIIPNKSHCKHTASTASYYLLILNLEEFNFQDSNVYNQYQY